MLGSLQEFIPDCHTTKLIDSSRNVNQSSQYNRNYSDRAERIKYMDLSLDTNKYGHHMHDIKYSKETIKSKYYESINEKQGNNIKGVKIESSFSRVIPSNSQRSRHLEMEYVAQDKSILLQKYKEYQINNKNQKNEFLRIQQLQRNTVKIKEKNQIKPSYFHMKGKLKSSHHLLQSLVRVEEQQMVNPNTFFQISFESMRNKYQTIKMENKLRDKPQANVEFKSLRVPLFINNKQLFRRNKQQSFEDIQKYIQKQPIKSLNLKIVNKNTIKWAKTRSKSNQSETKNRQISKSKSIELQKQQQVRKTIIKKIDGYINRANPSRKNSLRKSSFLNSSNLFL